MKCKEIFWMNLEIMKSILSLAEFKMGKNTDEYAYFKREIMNKVYTSLLSFYKKAEKEDSIIKCVCKASLRRGYSKCKECGGSGYTEKN